MMKTARIILISALVFSLLLVTPGCGSGTTESAETPESQTTAVSDQAVVQDRQSEPEQPQTSEGIPAADPEQPSEDEQEETVQPDTTKSTTGRTYVIVDTGQVICYNNSSEITPPQAGEAFYGQDAQYARNQPVYQDNGDGTVTDLNTGLMWQQDPGAKKTYNEAVAGAETFSLAGYDDWRLPTIKELYSLIIFSGNDISPDSSEGGTPFIDTGYFRFEYGNVSAGERIIDAQYWSSTEYLGTTMNGNATVFGVNFADGRIKGYPRDNGPGGGPMVNFVLYVRGNTEYGINDYVDNGDGTVTDKATGLMWSKTDSGTGLDWEEALAWVQQKNEENYLGYNDWRLPDAKELQSIVDYTNSPQQTGTAAIDPVFEITPITDEGGDTNYPFFWSGTTHADQSGRGSTAVYLSFGEALGYWMDSWTDVHGAGAQRSDPKSGDPGQYPNGRGPQGDAIRIYNYVRCVRDAG